MIKRFFKFIFGFIFWIVLLLAVVVVSAVLVIEFVVRGGGTVLVPNVIGLDLSETYAAMEKAGLRVKVNESATTYSSIVPKGHVVSQDPDPGTERKRSRPVYIVLSKGSKMVKTPRLVGQDFIQARTTATKAEFQVGHLSYTRYPASRDAVLAQDPVPDTTVERDTPINLLLSLGPAPKRYIMPSLTGLPVDSAANLLSQLSLLAKVKAKLDTTQPAETVVSQDPAPWSLVVEGDEVSLTRCVHDRKAAAPTPKWTVIEVSVEPGVREHLVLRPDQQIQQVTEVPAELELRERQVTIEMTDATGSWTVFGGEEGSVQPGTTIEVPVKYYDTMNAKVYVDDILKARVYFVRDENKGDILMEKKEYQ